MFLIILSTSKRESISNKVYVVDLLGVTIWNQWQKPDAREVYEIRRTTNENYKAGAHTEVVRFSQRIEKQETITNEN